MAFYDGLTPTIYAAPADAGTGDGSSEANAMDLPTALSTATAGAVVGLLPGVYTAANTNSRWDSAFVLTNNGSSGSPIIVVGKYDALLYYADTNNRTELRTSGYSAVGTALANGPVIGAAPGQDYLQFRNLFIDQTYAPPRSSSGTLQAGYGSTNIRFRKCVVSQTENPDGDNYNAIFAQNSTNLTVDYCYFYGGFNSTSGANHNFSCITTYGCLDFTFEHNTFEDVNACIFIKGGNPDAPNNLNSGTIRYNKALDCSNNFATLTEVDQTDGVDVYQNLAVRCLIGVCLEDSASGHVWPSRVYSNTIVDPTTYGGLSAGGFVAEANSSTYTGNTFRDNIVAFTSSTSLKAVQFDGTNTISGFTTFNYNLYWESGTSAQFLQNSTTYTGLAAWNTAVTPKEDNSTEGTPNFTSAATDDYTLSVADTGSSTGGARGAYITGDELLGAVESALSAASTPAVGPVLFVAS